MCLEFSQLLLFLDSFHLLMWFRIASRGMTHTLHNSPTQRSTLQWLLVSLEWVRQWLSHSVLKHFCWLQEISQPCVLWKKVRKTPKGQIREGAVLEIPASPLCSCLWIQWSELAGASRSQLGYLSPVARLSITLGSPPPPLRSNPPTPPPLGCQEILEQTLPWSCLWF